MNIYIFYNRKGEFISNTMSVGGGGFGKHFDGHFGYKRDVLKVFVFII